MLCCTARAVGWEASSPRESCRPSLPSWVSPPGLSVPGCRRPRSRPRSAPACRPGRRAVASAYDEVILAGFRDSARQRRAGEGAEAGGHPEPPPWPEPELEMVRARRLPAPAFPTWVLGPFWSRWAADAAEACGGPVDYVALPLLSATGALLANVRRASPWPGWTEPPVIWTADVGNPSAG